MIIFTGTKSVRSDHFLVFSNDLGSSIEIPVSEEIMIWFMMYFDRLSPPTKPVETQ